MNFINQCPDEWKKGKIIIITNNYKCLISQNEIYFPYDFASEPSSADMEIRRTTPTSRMSFGGKKHLTWGKKWRGVWVGKGEARGLVAIFVSRISNVTPPQSSRVPSPTLHPRVIYKRPSYLLSLHLSFFLIFIFSFLLLLFPFTLLYIVID